MMVSMSINGEAHSYDVEPRMLLVHYIREMAELHGTHWGCDTSNCGICVVLMNGEPIKSCTTLAAMAEGQEILTVEGLEKDGQLDPIQMGFHECHALQCGFCTPGMMVTGNWLINNHPDPTNMTEEDIRMAISGGLCRCTGYKNIVAAIRWAAAYRAGQPTVGAMSATNPEA
jgi:aerobic carbon-monoxide dehydrogenase small subunit